MKWRELDLPSIEPDEIDWARELPDPDEEWLELWFHATVSPEEWFARFQFEDAA